MSASVCVVITSKDEPSLAVTLAALADQVRRVGASVLVVDRSEGRLAHIAAEFPWVRWLDFVPPVGVSFTIAHQRNVGVHESGADIVAFCDCGGVPSEHWLEELIRPIVADGWQLSCGPIVATGSFSIYATVNDEPDGAVVESPPTANLALTRKVFDAVGGFDERYAYGSDVDFAWRCADAGFAVVQAAEAVMAMDWGSGAITDRRSWRYGVARGRWWRFHPKHRVAMLRRWPDAAVYPLLLMLAAVGVLLPRPLRRVAHGAFAGSVGLLALKAKVAGARPAAVLRDHFIGAAGFLFTVAVPQGPVVVHWPEDAGPYQPPLLRELAAAGVSAGFLREPTGSQAVNVLALPMRLALARVRGAKVWHVHWVFLFAPPAVVRLPFGRRLMRWWLGVCLACARALGLRVVWTAHNVVPHDQVFDDDVAARRVLAGACDVVVAHNELAADAAHRFGADRVEVIAQGVDSPAGRVRYDGADVRFLCAGVVRAYKGVDVLIDAASACDGVAVVVAGEPVGVDAEALTAAAELAGVDMRLGRLDRDAWEALWCDGTVAVLPYRSITNSGVLFECLARGVVAVVADLPAFAGVPDDAVVRFPPGDAAALAAALRRVASMTPAQRQEMSDAALRFAASMRWDVYAAATADVYRSIL